MKKFNSCIIISIVAASFLFSQPRAEQAKNIEVNYTNGNVNTQSVLNSSALTSTLIELNNTYRYIESNFLYDIDIQKVKEGLATGFMDSLGDEYSYYVPASEADDYIEDSQGQYVGIGTYLTKMNKSYIDMDDPTTYMVQIISPFPGGPADRAGIKSHDLISHINGESVKDLTSTEASKKIRGKEGVPITLTIVRGESTFDITLKPEKVTTPNLVKDIIKDNIGYICFYDFNQQTGKLFNEAIEELEKQGMDSLIIDLRNNGGGTVDSALQIADYLLEDCTLVTVEYKEGSYNQPTRYIASEGTILGNEIPIVILTNGGTASASEILTAALKENDRATVIGSKTFGKGIIQKVISFLDGYLQFTFAHYITPDDNDIHKVGITPDIEIKEPEYTDEELNAYAEFLKTNKTEDFQKQHPDYTTENIELFAKENEESKVPTDILRLLMRNQYIYSMDYNDRPVADTVYDDVLKRAIKFLEEGV